MVAKQTVQHRPGPYTVDDYDALPDDGFRYELIDGELIEMPAPSYLHQLVQAHFVAVLYFLVMQSRSGRVVGAPIDVRLGGVVVQPDVVYISNERAGIETKQRIIGAPDLVIEILSPSTCDHDLMTKYELYRLAGVREYWVVDLQERSATVWALVEDRYVEQRPNEQGRLVSTILPGFAVEIAQVIAAVE